MYAKEAYKKSLNNLTRIKSEQQQVKEAIEKINAAAESGEFECEYWNDDQVREALQMLGYNVSGCYTNDHFYGDEIMKISWKKEYIFEEDIDNFK